MPGVGRHCHELRILDESKTWRIVYHLADDAVVILDVFAKTTARTPQNVVTTCQQRLKRYCAMAQGKNRT